MTEHERYLFDLRGYIVIPDALTPEQITDLNALMDEQVEKECEPDERLHRFVHLLHWGQACRSLIDNPVIVPYLVELLGEQFRLDHDYAEIIRTGSGNLPRTFHGGAHPFNPVMYYNYHSGSMYNGLTVVAFNLKDIHPGDGGFGCVPGSHKSNLSFPEDWRDINKAPSIIEKITGQAGTAIIFTEALTHGTLPWLGKDDRRTIFYKYSPHTLSWAAQYYDADDYTDLTERQREILEAPNARYKERKEFYLNYPNKKQ